MGKKGSGGGDETGRPDKPFIGKHGPRKTRPKTNKIKREETEAVVTDLFTKERQAAPDQDRMKPEKHVARKTIKVGQRWSDAMEMMQREGMTMADFVKTLSPDELARGQLKAENGTFVGAPPKWVPAEFHKECIRELMRQGKELYQVSYLEAIRSMTLIANSTAVEPAQRIKAAQFVIERIEGKVPERLEVGVSQPWQDLLDGIVATVEPGALPTRAINEAAGPDDE